jgi:hypothetical protein
MRKIILIAAALISFATAASAQSASDSLSENMRLSLARCSGEPDTNYSYVTVKINDQCVRIQFNALQTYVDAATACIHGLAASGSQPMLSNSCSEALVLEKGLIKTFGQKPTVTKK